jgi:hypothetical protein
VSMSVQVTPLLSIVGFQFDVGWTTLYPLQSRECLYKVAWPGYTRVKNSIDVCWTFLYLPHPTPEQRTPLYSSLPGWHPLKNQNRCCWRFRCRYLFGYRFRLVSDFFFRFPIGEIDDIPPKFKRARQLYLHNAPLILQRWLFTG